MIRFRFTLSLVVLVLVCTLSRSLAQTSLTPSSPWGTWLIGTLVLPGGEKKWGGFAEVQGRANSVFNQFFYSELKGGVSYDLDKNFTLTVAGGRYATYDYKDLPDGPLNTEKRLWEQLIINQYLTRVKFEHRYRVEQRWFNFRDGTTPYRSRIRYRLNMFIPINNRTVTAKTTFLSVYDEVFLNPVGPTFERNRLYAGVGYQFDQQWIVQLGMVNQTNYNSATFDQGIFTPQLATGKYNVVVGLTYRLKRKNATEKLPTQPD
ncbi:DUF2490 domain-containing protein [Spirosoma pollinicola]|uniref:DUF2490 domain-containing protein n=1 Tax=Spirosoma pollinicola TaxID=2057025 RepID=A0A2K8YWP7_9BACT|nr:DUF2490 domain-containing protein [Spirosoma pollinicola]AUD01968.1 DUF2490 domain-containing protein [Spirosoma pollinicola]